MADNQAKAEQRHTLLEESETQRGREATEKVWMRSSPFQLTWMPQIQAMKEGRAEQVFRKHVQLISKLDKSEQVCRRVETVASLTRVHRITKRSCRPSEPRRETKT